jgi:serine protease Do
MKHIIYPFTFCLLSTALLSMTASAQSDSSNNGNQQKQQEEIIIREKGIPAQDMDIHIKGDEVWVNGKKLDGGADSSIMVLRRKVPVFNNNRSFAFSGMPEGGIELFQNGPGNSLFTNNNKALLGVVTATAEAGGAKITDISSGTSASKSDLQVGDVITKVNDDSIKSSEDLVTAIGKYQPGDEVTIDYMRDGSSHSTQVKLGKREGAMEMLGVTPGPDNRNWERQFRNMPMMPMMPGNGRNNFFYRFRNENPERPKLGLSIQDTENGKGVKVLSVNPSSPAAIAGIKKDDIIKQFGSKDINNIDDIVEALHNTTPGESIELKVWRDGKTKDITVKMPKHLRTMNL